MITKQKLTLDEFIKRANKIHNFKYDYSKTVYINAKTKLTIICKIHKEFNQRAIDHLNGYGCKLCKFDNQKLTTERFIEKAKNIHGNKYNYSKVEYKRNSIKVIIICNKHGEFEQTPNTHLDKCGCPKCKTSIGEKIIREWLLEKSIKFEEQKYFNGCLSNKNKRLLFDFYIPDLNICIEFDGKQHSVPYSFSSDKSDETKLKNFEIIQQRDNIKTQYCSSNNIRLLRIKHSDINRINNILKQEII
jgi:very-short-patch-repair endonuclease